MTPDPIGLNGGINLYAYAQNNSINWIDPYGLKMSDILPGIGIAITEGFKGSAYSVHEAVKTTHNIAVNGHPLAQTALGIAFVSEAAPLLGAAAIPVYPAVAPLFYNAAPYSEAIVDSIYGFFPQTGSPKGFYGYTVSFGRWIVETYYTILSSTEKSGPCEK